MRIYSDIGHPAYFHFFKNFIATQQRKGYSFLITARDKDITLNLFDCHNISKISRGSGSHTTIGRYINAIKFLIINTWKIKRFNPTICVSIGSPYTALISWIIRKPCIIFEDTESAFKLFWIYRFFAKAILTPSSFKMNLGQKQLFFDGYKEHAYLHKKYYSPNPSIFKILGIADYQPYMLFRFVSHKVHHDKTKDGLTFKMKEKLINYMSKVMTVFVSSEIGVVQYFPEFEIKIPIDRMHDVIAFSKLVIGESSTMAAEAAILGVPSIFFDNYGRGYTDELEKKYKMISLYHISEFNVDKAIRKSLEILQIPDYLKNCTNYSNLCKNNFDLTAFMIWFIENYPESARIMKEYPDFQNRFK